MPLRCVALINFERFRVTLMVTNRWCFPIGQLIPVLPCFFLMLGSFDLPLYLECKWCLLIALFGGIPVQLLCLVFPRAPMVFKNFHTFTPVPLEYFSLWPSQIFQICMRSGFPLNKFGGARFSRPVCFRSFCCTLAFRSLELRSNKKKRDVSLRKTLFFPWGWRGVTS